MDFHMQWGRAAQGILRKAMPVCEMEHMLCSKVRATVNFLRFSHCLQNILSCVWLHLWHRVGNLGGKFFMNQEILARVLKIFWSEIFTSLYNPERKQVALQCIWGFSVPCSGSWKRAQGWVCWGCCVIALLWQPATKALESPFPTGWLVCNLQHGICLEHFPSASECKLKTFISIYFHWLFYIHSRGICMYTML